MQYDKNAFLGVAHASQKPHFVPGLFIATDRLHQRDQRPAILLGVPEQRHARCPGYQHGDSATLNADRYPDEYQYVDADRHSFRNLHAIPNRLADHDRYVHKYFTRSRPAYDQLNPLRNGYCRTDFHPQPDRDAHSGSFRDKNCHLDNHSQPDCHRNG